MSHRVWYLAGPFFNPRQKEAALKVRDLVKKSGRFYYAPVEDIFQDSIDDKAKAAKIFEQNVSNLENAEIVLCHLDWITPGPEIEVRAIRPAWSKEDQGAQAAGKVPVQCQLASPVLNVPDSGTVWELGYACALRTACVQAWQEKFDRGKYEPEEKLELQRAFLAPRTASHGYRPLIVGYTLQQQPKLNLMLSRSCNGFLSGWVELEQFVVTGTLEKKQLRFSGSEI